jgi:DNA-binding beta-propeller fold protein YncE
MRIDRNCLFRLSITAFIALHALSPLAQQSSPLVETIVVPGSPLEAFDIGWVDPTTQTYYFSDRSNRAVDIIDAKTNAFVGRVEGFAGPSTSTKTAGPNGVVALPKLKQVWASNGDSTVKIIDVKTRPPRIIASISTGGAKRANEMAYAEEANMVMVTNEAENPPYVTLISTAPDHKLLGQIKLPEATDGLEQPIWDRAGRRFYLSIPELDHDKAKGAIAEIDPKSMKVTRLIPVSRCMPAGLAFGPAQRLLVGCSDDAIAAGFPPKSLILDVKAGSIVQTIAQVGGSDEVWYNPGDHRYYLAARGMPGGAVLGVIDAKANLWVANVPTAKNAHSVAANPGNNHIFVPLTPNPACPTGCIGVYAGGRIQSGK